MNETLWLAGTDPLELLAELYPMSTLGSELPQTRQSRMYLLACARRAWDRLPGVCRALVALAEVYTESPAEQKWLRSEIAPIAEQLMQSDGEASDLLEAETELSMLGACGDTSLSEMLGRVDSRDQHARPPFAPGEWQGLVRLVYLPFVKSTPAYKWVPPALHACDLLREVFGNPCRFVPFPHAWRTSDAVALARQMYDTRDFTAMPILADALQDAGCDNPDILDHCRSAGPHVRGCWVLDRVLNRK